MIKGPNVEQRRTHLHSSINALYTSVCEHFKKPWGKLVPLYDTLHTQTHGAQACRYRSGQYIGIQEGILNQSETNMLNYTLLSLYRNNGHYSGEPGAVQIDNCSCATQHHPHSQSTISNKK